MGHETDRSQDAERREADDLNRFRTVSLKYVAELLDTSRSSARRWLRDAGIQPIAIGSGRRGAIRYRWVDVERWLTERQHVE